MKKNNFKRTLSLIIAGLITMSAFTACDTTEPTSSTPSTNSSQASSTPASEGPDMDGDVVLNELGEFPIVVGDKITISAFTAPQLVQNSVFEYEENDFTKYFEDLTNIHIDWTTVSQADKVAKLNIMFAGGDYQDVVMGSWWNGAELYSYGNQGFLIPLNEYYENDTFYYDIVREAAYEADILTPEIEETMYSPDGNIYAMYKFGQALHSGYANRMWIYEPWLEAVDAEMPTTTDELYNVLKLMATEDPNGNGVADEVPLAGSKQGSGWNTQIPLWMFNSFMYYDNVEKTFLTDGKVETVYDYEGLKEAVTYMNMLVEEGLMLSESFTQDVNALKTLTGEDNKIAGVVPGGSIASFTAMVDGEEGDWANWTALDPVAGPDGTQYTKWFVPYPAGMINITNQCEYPRATFRLFDALYEEEIGHNAKSGMRGEYWDYVEGEVAINGEEAIYKLYASSNTGTTQDTNYTWSQIANNNEMPGWHSYQALKGDSPEIDMESILYNAGNAYSAYNPGFDVIVPRLTFVDEYDAKLVVDYKTALNQEFDIFVADAIVNGDIDAKWDAYIATIQAIGVEDYEALLQMAYDEQYGA